MGRDVLGRTVVVLFPSRVATELKVLGLFGIALPVRATRWSTVRACGQLGKLMLVLFLFGLFGVAACFQSCFILLGVDMSVGAF